MRSKKTNMPAGYKLDRYAFGTTDPATGTVTITSTDKVIRVYYTADDTSTLNYTVRYFKDTETTPFDSTEDLTVPVSNPYVQSVDMSNMPTGYMLDSGKKVTFPVHITENGQRIDIYYIVNPNENLSYSIEHYKIMPGQNKDTATLYQTKAGTVPVYDPAVSPEAISIPGYAYDTAATGTLPAEITTNGQVVKLYYQVDTTENGRIFDYTVQYFIAGTNQAVPGIDQVAVGTPSGKGYSGESINLSHPSLETGYTVTTGQPETLTVTEDGKATATIYYEVDTTQNVYAYTVNYLLENGDVVPGTTPQIGRGAIDAQITIDYPSLANGYKRAPGQPDTFVLDENNKVVNVYYEPDSAQALSYTVQYYKDNVLLDSASMTGTVSKLTPTVTLADIPENQLPIGYKVDSYAFGNVEETSPATETVTITETNNLIKVFYVPDETQTYQYTVNYYRDNNIFIESKTATVSMAHPQVTATTEIEGTAIQSIALPAGYKLDIDLSTALPTTISPTNYTINVYYKPNPEGQYTYKVHYYLMEPDPTTGEYTVPTTNPVPGVTPNPVIGNGVAGEVINIAQLPGGLGYQYVSGPNTLMIDGTAAGDNSDDKNTVTVYYKKDLNQFTDVTVKHVAINGPKAAEDIGYGPGVLAVQTLEGKIGDTFYGQPMAVAEYTYQPESSTASGTVAQGLTLTLEYTARNALSYTVSYVDGSGKAISEPIVKTDETWTVNDTIDIDPSIGKDIPGYTLRENTLPATLTLENTGNEIRLVYDTDAFGYTVHYYLDGTTTSLRTDKTETAQAYGTTVVEVAPVIPGYTIKGDTAQHLRIGSVPADNVLTFYYLAASESPTIDRVLTSDTKIAGTAIAGATVTLTFPAESGEPIVITTQADPEGNYSADIPTGANKTAGQNISATAKEDGKGESSPVTTPYISDRDGDGLSDDEEAFYNTDPDLADTDGDGLTDYEEVFGTRNTAFNNQPTDPNRADTDGDGITDYDEIMGTKNTLDGRPTDPNRKDTDGDGKTDDNEIRNGTDPNNKDD